MCDVAWCTVTRPPTRRNVVSVRKRADGLTRRDSSSVHIHKSKTTQGGHGPQTNADVSDKEMGTPFFTDGEVLVTRVVDNTTFSSTAECYTRSARTTYAIILLTINPYEPPQAKLIDNLVSRYTSCRNPRVRRSPY